jgi:hypothetical protein
MSSDTLRRHMRSMHGVEAPARIKFACTSCRNQKARCQGGSPCSNCLRRGLQCSLAQEDEDEGQQMGDLSGSTDTRSVAHPSPTHPKASRSEKERHYISLYFRLFHPYWRFIHQGSFKESAETPLLVQSMVVIGLWLSNEDNAQSRAIALHNVLSSAIHQQRVCSPTFGHRSVYCTNHGRRRRYGMLRSPSAHAVPVPGLSRHTRLSCFILFLLYYIKIVARWAST